MDQRIQALADWISAQGVMVMAFEPGGGDASSRRYFRLMTPEGSLIAMDAPEQTSDCEAFLTVQSLMAKAGLHVPDIKAADAEAGFMLLEDLGEVSFLTTWQSIGDEGGLVDSALDALVRWQLATQPGVLEAYDAGRLGAELELFPVWYVDRHLGLSMDSTTRSVWEQACQILLQSALNQPQVWVHRDFMGRNLLVSEPNPGVIDFQDALTGPVTYDIVSLLRDAFYSFTPAQESYYLSAYYARAQAAGVPLPVDWQRCIDLMGAQRHLKVLGIFARLCHRDGKPHYLRDAPRFLGYLARELAPYPDLGDLRRWLISLPTARPQ